MVKSAEFGVPCRAAMPGRCRICGCTRITACDVATHYGSRACGWIDETRTLCDAPKCLAAARAELNVLERIEGPTSKRSGLGANRWDTLPLDGQ